MRVKSSGMVLGLANSRPPGSGKFANAPPPGLTRRANGRGGRGWVQVELTDALSAFLGQTQTYLNHAGSSGPEEACSRCWLH